MASGRTLEDELATEAIDVLRDYGVLIWQPGGHSRTAMTERFVQAV